MPNMTLSLPDDLYDRMREHPELKWSEVARQAFEQKIDELELMEELLERSELTEADAEELGHRLKAEIRKRFD